MSAITTYIKVEHIRLETGEVLILDGVIFLIESVERLVYSEEIDIAAAARGAATNLQPGLLPEDDEIYHCEFMGISHEYFDANSAKQVFPSGALFRIAYPRGDPRYTPHGVAIPLDENLASRLDPFRVDLWIKPATFPAIVFDNSLNQAITVMVWFYGWKYRTKVMTRVDLDSARARGVKVLEIERYVSK